MGITERILVVITGAGRGIGREISVQLARLATDGSVFLLVARSLDELTETRRIILRDGIKVQVAVFDFASTDCFDLTYISDEIDDIKSVILIHNAGTVGDITKKADGLIDARSWSDHLQTNVTGPIVFNNRILNFLKSRKNIDTVVVNITSLLAVQAYPSFAQYSTSKAAREAFFRALVLERPDIRTLNYSPGPVNTTMRTTIANRSYAPEIRKAFSTTDSSPVSRSVVTVEDTVAKLTNILKRNEFENGARIDFFDE